MVVLFGSMLFSVFVFFVLCVLLGHEVVCGLYCPVDHMICIWCRWCRSVFGLCVVVVLGPPCAHARIASSIFRLELSIGCRGDGSPI